MPEEASCIKVPKNYGEIAITLVNKLGLIEETLEIQRDETFIYIPLSTQPSTNHLEKVKEKIPDVQIITKIFSKRKKKTRDYAEMLAEELPPHLFASLPRSIDFVGDIAIIEIPPELSNYKNLIGKAILKTHKTVRTVLAKASAVSGTYRLREFEVIAGDHKTETIHREYGCQYYVDLSKAYFSPRLSFEHNRVASLVHDGETVVDLFAGVGPFAILIAKIHENVRVYAIDINPSAIKLLKRNIRLNRVEEKVYPILGDAKQAVEKLSGIADRVIMNLPEKAMEFVETACKALKPASGIIHFYGFISVSEPLETMKTKFINAVENSGRRIEEISFVRLVRGTAPYEWQAALDAKIR